MSKLVNPKSSKELAVGGAITPAGLRAKAPPLEQQVPAEGLASLRKVKPSLKALLNELDEDIVESADDSAEPSASADESAQPSAETTLAAASSTAAADLSANTLNSLAPTVTSGALETAPGKSVEVWSPAIQPQGFRLLMALGGAFLLGSIGSSGSGSPSAPQSNPGEPDPEPLASFGAAIDGYLANALVWRDANGDQQWNPGEHYVFTDASGLFKNLTSGPGTLRLAGLTPELRALLTNESSDPTTDISTGKTFTGILSAPAGSTVITPLTTLVVATGGDAVKLAALKTALGIDPSIDLSQYDPLATLVSGSATPAQIESALNVQTASLKIANLMSMAATAVQSLDANFSLSDMVTSVAESLVAQASSTGLNLDTSAALRTTLQAAASGSGVTIDPATLTAAAEAMETVNIGMTESLDAAIDAAAGNELSLSDALSVMTQAVASQLVVQESLLPAVAASTSSGGAIAIESDNFSPTALKDLVNTAKSTVETLVVAPPTQSTMVAVDDFGLINKAGAADWTVLSGNLVGNDLSGNAAKLIQAAVNGTTSTSDSLTPLSTELSLTGDYGTLVVKADGSYTYTVTKTVPANSVVRDTFTYQVGSGNSTDLGTLTLTLDARNDAPKVSAVQLALESAGTVSAGTVNLLAGATDADRDPLTVNQIKGQSDFASTGPWVGQYGTLSLVGGKYTYQLDPANASVNALAPNATVRDVFLFGVTDGTTTTQSTLTVTITGSAVVGSPVLLVDSNNGVNTISESAASGTTVANLQLQGSDADTGTRVTLSLVDNPNGLFVLDGNQVKLAAGKSLDYETATSHTIAVKATSTDGGSVTQNFTIAVTNVNEAPVIASGTTGSVAENAAVNTVVYTAQATDVDASTTLRYSLGGTDAASFVIDDISGAVTLKAAANFEAKTSYSIDVIASDGVLSDSKAVTITVTNVNEAPVINSGTTGSVTENADTSTVVYTAAATDVDASTTLSFSLGGTDAALFNIDSNNGKVTLAASANFEVQPSYNIQVIASDGVLSDSQAVTITVTDVNEAPVITSGTTGSVAENAAVNTVVYTAQATDVDASTTLRYSLGGTDAALFNIDSSNGKVTLIASANYEAKPSYSIDVIASDGGLSDSKAVTITVTNVNEAPLLKQNSPSEFVLINGKALTPISLADGFADPENNELTFSLASALPTGLSFDPITATFSGTPTTDGSYSVTLRVGDGSLFSDQIYTLRVVSQPVVVSVSADKTAAKAGDPLTFTVTLSEPVTIDTTKGTPVLVFDVDGKDMLAEYRAVFGSGTSTATSVLTFVATAIAGTDTQVTIKSLSLGGATVKGNLTDQSLSTQTSARVDNFAVDNLEPVFTSGQFVIVEENIDTTTAIYTASASDDTALSYRLWGPNSSAFNLSNGVLTFKNPPDFETFSSYVVCIDATDAAGNTRTQNLIIGVTDVNEAPTAITLSNVVSSLPENTSTSSRVKVADIAVTDDAKGSNTFTLTGTDAALFEVIGKALYLRSGVVLDHESVKNNYAVTVSVGDATVNGSSVSTPYTLGVSNVNEAPIYTSGSLTDQTVQVGTATSIVVPSNAFTDPDVGAKLSYVAYVDNVLIASQNWISFDATTQTFVLKADVSQRGAHTLTVEATDAGGLKASHTFGLNVTLPVGQGILKSHIAQLTDFLDNPTTIGPDYTQANLASVNGLFDASSGLLNLGSAALKVTRGNLLHISDGKPDTVGNAPLLSLSLGAVPSGEAKSASLQIALTRGSDSVKASDESQVSVLLNVDMLNVGNQWVMRAAGTSASPQKAMVQIRSSTINGDLPFDFDSNDLIASTSGSGETLQLNVNAFALLTKLNSSAYGPLLGSFLNDGTYTLSIQQQSGAALPLLNSSGQALDGVALTLSIDSNAINQTPFLALGSDLQAIQLAIAPEQILPLGQFLQSGGGTDTKGGPRFALTDPENNLSKIWLLQPQSGTYGLRQSATEITWFTNYQTLSDVRILPLNVGDLSKLVYQAPAALDGAASVSGLGLQFMLEDNQQNFSPLHQLAVKFNGALLTQSLATEGSAALPLLTLATSQDIQSLPTQGKLFFVRGDTRTEIKATGTSLLAGDRLEYEAPAAGGLQASAGEVLLRSFDNAKDTYTFTTLALQVNHLPSLTVTGTAQTVIEDADTVSTSVTVTVSDIDTSNVLSWQSAGWTVNNGVLSQNLTYGIATLSPVSGGEYTLSYALDPVRSQSLNTTPVNEVLTLVVSDGLGGTASRTVTFVVQGVNDAAAFVKLDDSTPFDAVRITEGAGPVSGRLVVSDIDSPATVEASQITGKYGQFEVTENGEWTYTPNGDLNALKAQTYTDDFVVTTADGTTKTVTVTIQGVNDAPVPKGFSDNVKINQVATFDLVKDSTDPEGDLFTATQAVLRQGGGQVSLVNGVVTFTPATNFSGQVYIDYTLKDANNATSNGVISLFVGDNTPPTGKPVLLSTLEDTHLVFSAANFGFEDADLGQSFSAVRIDSLPLAGVLKLGANNVVANQVIPAADIAQLSFVPAANASATGYASFTFSVQDSAGAFAASPSTVTINVAPVNDLPEVTSVTSVSVPENTSSDFYTATATDIDSAVLTYSISGADADMFTIDASTGALKFAEAPNFEAPGSAAESNTYSIVLEVSDGVGKSTQALSIVITNVNEAPVITSDDEGTVAENAAISTVVYTATAEDVDANTKLTYSLSGTDASFFNIDPSSGVVKLNASAKFEDKASYSINVVASDGTFTTTKPVTIDVQDLGSDGAAIDGYLANALVWRDADGDKQFDSGESYVFTDASGAFKDLTNGAGTLRLASLTDGLRALLTNAPSGDTTDISTGKTFTGILSAPEGSTVITPLTTLVVATEGNAVNLAALKTSLGIDASIDLSTFDPLATLVSENATAAQIAAALKVQTASLKIANLMSMAATAVQSLDANFSLSDMVASVAQSLVDQASSTGLNLDTSAALRTTLQAAASGAGVTIDSATLTAAATAMASVNTSMTSSVSTAILAAANGLSLNDALSVMTQAVASQLVVQESLLPAVAASASSGGVIAINTSSFSGDALLDQVNAAKSSVETLVVADTTQSTTVAVDDFGLINKAGIAPWTALSGNLVSNDLSGNAAKQILAAVKGTTSTADTLTPLSTELSLTGVYGTLVVKANGSYTYTVTNSGLANSLVTDTFTYQVGSGNSTDLGTLTLTLDARNDAPKVSAVQLALESAGAVSAATVNLLAGATDADRDPLTVDQIKGQSDFASTGPWVGQYGTLSLVGGKYTYQLDPANASVNALAPNATVRDVFLFGVTDGTTTTQSTLTVTITGSAVVGSPVLLVDSDSSNNGLNTISENVASGTAVANLQLLGTDADNGTTVTLSLVGNPNGLFVLDGNQVKLASGKSLDYETASSHTIAVKALSSDGGSVTQAFTINVTDVNEAPTAIKLNNVVSSLPENTSTSSRVKVADIQVTDDALGTNTFTLTGTDATSFEVIDKELYLKSGVVLDHEAVKNNYAVTVSVGDITVVNGSTFSANYSLSVTDVNEAPTAITLNSVISSLAENTGTSSHVKVADIEVIDDALGTNTITLTGDDATSFEVIGNALYLKSGVVLDHESVKNYAVTVSVGDATAVNGSTSSANYSLSVTDVNEAPTAITLNSVISSLAENTSTSSRVKVADIQVTDDELGTNTFTLTGTDATSFEVIDNALYLKSGVVLNHEAVKNNYAVTVSVGDATIVNGNTFSADYALTVTNVNEAPFFLQESPTDFVLINDKTLTPISLAGGFADPEQNTLTYSLTGTLPTGLSFDASTATFSGKPTTDGSYSVTLRVSDGALFSDQSYTLRVVSEPVVVSVTADKAAAKAGDSLTFTVTLSETVTIDTTNGKPELVFDVAGNNMVAEYRAVFGSGTSTATNVLTFAATATAGTDTQVTIKSLSLGNATVTGNVTGQSLSTQTSARVENFVVDNSAPVFTSGTSVSVAENINTSTGVYTASASDDTTLSYSLGGTHNLAFNLLDGVLTFKDRPDFETRSSYEVSITATDAAGNASTQNVTIAVTDVNEAPTAISLSASSVPENQVVGSAFKIGDITTTDPDATGNNNVLTVNDTTNFKIEGGVLYFIGTGPDFETKASYSVTITSTDGALTKSQAFTINVTNVNEAPSLVNALIDQTVQAAQSKTFTLSGDAFADVDGDALTYTATTSDGLALPSWLVFNADRSFTVSPLGKDVGAIDVKVTASDSKLSASDIFRINVTAPTGQAMLQDTTGVFTNYLDTNNNGQVDYLTSQAASLDGVYDSLTGYLNYANTGIQIARANVLALADGNAATVGTAPTLGLQLANVPTIAGTLSSTIAIALTAGLDATKENGESSVRLSLNIDTLNVGGQLVMRAQTQKATISVSNGSGTLKQDVEFDFNASDIIASTSTSGGQALLQFNVMSLLAKLDGTFYGQVLGQFLNDGNYTLSIVRTSGGHLPLQTDAGEPIKGITVGLPITSAAINFVPQLVFGSDIYNAKLELDIPPQTVLDLGQFLLTGAGFNASSNQVKRFALSDANGPQDLFKIWFLQPENGQGTLGLRDANTGAIIPVQDGQYQALGSEKIYGLAFDDLSRLVYTAPSTDTDASVNLRFLLEDQQHAFSTLQSIAIDLKPGLQQSSIVTEGQELNLTELGYASTVESLPTQGKVYSVQGVIRTELKLGDVVPANAKLVYVGPAVDASSQVPAGQWSVRGFDTDTDTYVTTTQVLAINHLPTIGASSATLATLSEDDTTARTVQITLADEDSADTAFINLTGWTPGQNGAYTQSLQYGVATLSPVSGQAGQYTLSYSVDARSQALGNTLAQDPLTLTVLDSQGASRQTTVTFQVQGVNDAATFAAEQGKLFDTVSITETDAVQTFTGQVLVSDVDSATTVVAETKTGTYGTFSIGTNGAWTYTTKSALNELNTADKPSEEFTITTADGSTKTVTVGITGTNDAPVAVVGKPYDTIPINTEVTIDLADLITDPDNTAEDLTISAHSLTQGQGVVALDGQQLKFTPALNFSGAVTIGYTVQDPAGASDTGTVTFIVGVNNAPISEDETLTIDEDSTSALTSEYFAFADADAGQSTLGKVIIKSVPTEGKLFTVVNGLEVDVKANDAFTGAQLDAGHLKYRPALDANGSNYASFDFQVADSGNLASDLTYTLTFDVNAVNDAPKITSDVTGSVAENADISIVAYTVTATDVDVNTTLRYSLGGTDAALFNIDGSTGKVTLIASANYEAKPSYSIDVIASDGVLGASGTLSTTKAVTIIVTDVNEAPQITSAATGTVAENAAIGTAVYTAAATDLDANTTLRYSLGGTDAAFFNINSSTGVVTLKASADYEVDNSYSIDVIARDGEVLGAPGTLSATKAVTITVTDVNEAPTAIVLNNQQSIVENTTTQVVVGTIAVTDPDNNQSFPANVLTLDGADKGLFSIDGDKLVFNANPSVDYETRRDYSVTVVANAGTPLAASQSFTINVDNVIDTLTLADNTIRVTDHDSSGRPTTTLVEAQSNSSGTLTLSLSDSDALNRVNLLRLLDGDKNTTGIAPTIEFALQNTDQIALGTHQVHLDLALSNERFNGLSVSVGVDLAIELTRTADGVLQLTMPATPVDLVVKAGGFTVLTKTVQNLDSDTISLVGGSNGIPNLSVKIDNLFDKAMDSTVAIRDLDSAGTLAIASGLVMGLLGGKSIGDLVALLQDIVTLPNDVDLPSANLTQLFALLRDTISLPADWQQLSFDQVLSVSAQVLKLPDTLSFGDVLTLMRSTIELPPSLQGTLGSLKGPFVNATDEQTVNQLESLARAMLGGTQESIAHLNIPQLLDLLADSTIAGQSIQSLGSGAVSYFEDYNTIALFNDAARVVEAFYGHKTLAELLVAAQSNITLPAELADLQALSLVGLLDLGALAMAAQDLLGSNNLSINGLLNLVRSFVTIDGVIDPSRISDLLALIDNSIDLQPLLGTDVNLSDLISNIGDPTLQIHPLLQIAAQTFLSSNGHMQATVDLPTLGLTDATGQLIQQVVVQAPIASIDQLTLDSAYVTVHDVNQNNEDTSFSVLGDQNGGTLTLDLSAGQGGTALNRSNILQLFDGDPQTGRSPTLQFALKDTHDVPLGLSTVGVQFSIQNDRLASLTLAADFDVQIELVRDNIGQLQIELPAQTVQIALSAAGMPVTTVQVSNLSPDMFELVSGTNGTPSLSLKIDSLLDKAIGNTLALSSLSEQGSLTLAAGLVMGLVGGKSVGELLGLLKDSVDLSGDLPATSITRLLQLVQDTVTLPPALQNLSIGQLLSTAASVLKLDSSLTVGKLIGVLQDTFELPEQFNTLSLDDLQDKLPDSASTALDRIQSIALAMLQEDSPNAQLSDFSPLTLSGLLDKIADSTLANQSLDSLGTLVNAQISGYSGVALIKDLAIVVNGLYGDKSALQVLQLLQESATLPAALAGLEAISLAELIDLSGLALAAADLLGPENLSIAGLTQLIYEAVTLGGQLNQAQINQAIDDLDTALNLQPLLGKDYSLRDLFSNLSDPEIEMLPVIEIASKVLFSSDGQASLRLDLPDSLVLHGTTGQDIQRIVVNIDLSDTPNTAGEFINLSYQVDSDDVQFDLGSFLKGNYVDPQGDELAGLLIDQPWVGDLMLALDNEGQTTYTPLFQNNATVAQVSLDELSQLVFVAPTTPDGQVLDLGVELQLRAVDTHGAIGEQQQLQLAFGNYPFNGI